MEVGGHGAADGGLAAAGLTGEQTDAAQIEQMQQAGFGFLACGGSEQAVGFQGVGEGQAGKGEVAQIHQSVSRRRCRWRRVSGEGGGWGAGASDWSWQEGRARLTEALA